MCGTLVAIATRGVNPDTNTGTLVVGERRIVGLSADRGEVRWVHPLMRGAVCADQPVRGEVVCIVDGAAPGVAARTGTTVQYIRFDSGRTRSDTLPDTEAATVYENSLVTASTSPNDEEKIIIRRHRTPYSPGWTSTAAQTPPTPNPHPVGIGMTVRELSGPGGFLEVWNHRDTVGTILDGATGHRVTKARNTGPYLSATSLLDGQVAVYGVDATTVLDRSGRQVRRIPGSVGYPIAFKPTVGDPVYRAPLSDDQHRDIAVDLATGERLPSVPTTIPEYPDAPPSIPGVPVGEIIPFTSTSGHSKLGGLTYHYHGAMDIRSGRVLWTTAGRLPETRIGDDGIDTILFRVTAKNGRSLLRAFDLRRGRIRWEFESEPYEVFANGVATGKVNITSYTAG